jgi:hypothetical protein
MGGSNPEESPEEEVPILDEFGNKIYEPYLMNDVYVYFVNDYTVHGKDAIPQQFNTVMKVNPDRMFYEPFIILTDFWSYKSNSLLLNSTVSEANFTLNLKP